MWEQYRWVQWYCNINWLSQDIPELSETTKEWRTKELLSWYWKDYLYQDLKELGIKYKIDEAVVVCIAKADSNLWKQLKTKNNFGNVGNTDSWATRSFATETEGFEAIFQTLNNKYLGSYEYIRQLDGYHNDHWYIYATSKSGSRGANVWNCLSVLNWYTIDGGYQFRTK